ncbi:hypothetical protein [Streptacidiphilus melanogenes]|uniref:hypothetical protein n=1 Tax=Streptacidiphilus melanogenes TaxID=411235 RepID=UPI0005A8CD87|nr:hypothetical protein [Streptacidiphilus melanogenes]
MQNRADYLELRRIVDEATAEAHAANPVETFPDGHFMDPSTTDDEIAAHLASLGFHAWRYR